MMSWGNDSIRKKLLQMQNKENQNSLHIALKYGYKEMALRLIELHWKLNLNLDQEDKLNQTPLSLLFSQGNYNFNFDVFENGKSKELDLSKITIHNRGGQGVFVSKNKKVINLI